MTSAGVTPRPLRRMLQATMRNLLGFGLCRSRPLPRPPLCNDIRLVETYPDSRDRRRSLLPNARPDKTHTLHCTVKHRYSVACLEGPQTVCILFLLQQI